MASPCDKGLLGTLQPVIPLLEGNTTANSSLSNVVILSAGGSRCEKKSLGGDVVLREDCPYPRIRGLNLNQ